ncbi:MAG: 3-phosphoshikimate 1-carboxyvinyltransferase [Dehalococcoidales bacterium]
MKATVDISEVKGKVSVPSSKSLTIRALMCAALSRGESEISNPLVSDDTNAAAAVLEKIGVGIVKDNNVWRVSGGKLRMPVGDIDCGESATTMRFLTAIIALVPGEHRLVGGPMLTKRPIRPLVEALARLGVKGATAGKTTPPVTITGGTFTGGATLIEGNVSSQYISALLLLAPFSKTATSIKLTTPLTSRPYVLMTIWCLKQFGINVTVGANRFLVKRQRYQPAKVNVEGDWSTASYFLALGAISEEGIQIENLKTASFQGDRVMLDFLRGMGAAVRVSGDTVTVSRNRLRAINADLSDCIDLLPTLAVLAALAEGQSVFVGVGRARIKESNRVAAVKDGLLKMGVNVVEQGDRLAITGLKIAKKPVMEDEEDAGETSPAQPGAAATPPKEPVVIDSYGDHRIAMAFAVLGASLGGITIDGAECVTKTFPGFWEAFAGIGGKIRKHE